MTNLDELGPLLLKASAGPWIVYVHTGDGATIEPGDDWTIYGKDRAPVVFEGGFSTHSSANAALIAALRNSAEELIRDARRMEWAEANMNAIDTVSHPDNLVMIWYGPRESSAAGRTLRVAIDAAIAQEGKP